MKTHSGARWSRRSCAVLYVHGFSDYFFQRHMAERFASVLSLPGAWHDLACSPRTIREAVFSQLFAWAERAVA